MALAGSLTVMDAEASTCEVCVFESALNYLPTPSRLPRMRMSMPPNTLAFFSTALVDHVA
jgi:hypothetical protein